MTLTTERRHEKPFRTHGFGVLLIVFVAEDCANNARNPDLI
jgi:hypothetical protein